MEAFKWYALGALNSRLQRQAGAPANAATKAVAALQKAVELDPNYAASWEYLALAMPLPDEGLEGARAALKALALAPPTRLPGLQGTALRRALGER